MLMFLFVTSHYWIVIILIKAIPNESDTLASSIQTMSESTNLEMLAKGLKLVVPSSVKDCRTAGAQTLSKKAKNDVKKSSLVILQANIGKENPSHSDFVLCSQRIISLFPETKDPIPSIHLTWIHEIIQGSGGSGWRLKANFTGYLLWI